ERTTVRPPVLREALETDGELSRGCAPCAPPAALEPRSPGPGGAWTRPPIWTAATGVHEAKQPAWEKHRVVGQMASQLPALRVLGGNHAWQGSCCCTAQPPAGAAMHAKSEIPWVYLCLKVQFACPQVGARLALGLAHTWPANDSAEPPVGAPARVSARRDS